MVFTKRSFAGSTAIAVGCAIVAACSPTQSTPTQSDGNSVRDFDAVLSDAGTPILYERSPARLGALEVDDTYLYWTERSASGFYVMRAPKAVAGPVTTVGLWSGAEVSSQMMEVDVSHLYWLDDTKITKHKKSTAGLGAIDIGTPLPGGWRMLLDGDDIYVADRSCLTVGYLPKAGGAPTFVSVAAHDDLGSSSLAIDATSLFCAGGTALLMGPKGGDVAEKLVTLEDPERIGPMISDDSFVYFAVNRGPLGTGKERLAMVAKTGGAIIDLGPIGLPVISLSLDSVRQRIYGATARTAGRDVIFTLSIGDRSLTMLAEGQRVWGGVAQDENYVYWSSETAIHRLAK